MHLINMIPRNWQQAFIMGCHVLSGYTVAQAIEKPLESKPINFFKTEVLEKKIKTDSADQHKEVPYYPKPEHTNKEAYGIEPEEFSKISTMLQETAQSNASCFAIVLPSKTKAVREIGLV